MVPCWSSSTSWTPMRVRCAAFFADATAGATGVPGDPGPAQGGPAPPCGGARRRARGHYAVCEFRAVVFIGQRDAATLRVLQYHGAPGVHHQAKPQQTNRRAHTHPIKDGGNSSHNSKPHPILAHAERVPTGGSVTSVRPHCTAGAPLKPDPLLSAAKPANPQVPSLTVMTR